MTKSTLINLSNIFLLPTKIVKHFHNKQPNEFYNNIKDIIPYSNETWDMISIAQYNDKLFKGYPYPFKYKWNGQVINDSIEYLHGGSGVLSLDLIYKNNIVMFDYYENLINKVDDLTKIPFEGFPFSNHFLVLSHMLNLNK